MKNNKVWNRFVSTISNFENHHRNNSNDNERNNISNSNERNNINEKGKEIARQLWNTYAGIVRQLFRSMNVSATMKALWLTFLEHAYPSLLQKMDVFLKQYSLSWEDSSLLVAQPSRKWTLVMIAMQCQEF